MFAVKILLVHRNGFTGLLFEKIASERINSPSIEWLSDLKRVMYYFERGFREYLWRGKERTIVGQCDNILYRSNVTSLILRKFNPKFLWIKSENVVSFRKWNDIIPFFFILSKKLM